MPNHIEDLFRSYYSIFNRESPSLDPKLYDLIQICVIILLASNLEKGEMNFLYKKVQFI